MTKLLVGIALSCMLAAPGCRQHKANPWVGSWKLDTAASKLGEVPRQEVMQIEAADRGSIKYTIRGTSDDGKQYSESYDGKPDRASAVMVNAKQLGTIVYHWESERVCTADGKGPGGNTLSETATLSEDGKTLTIKSREGKEEEETAVYRK